MSDASKGSAVVALSGGQDSATCLFYAKREYEHVAAVSFDYGQRHRVELDCAHRLAAMAKVSHDVIYVPAFKQLGDAALTNPGIDVEAVASGYGHAPHPGAKLPVPRNVHAAQHALPSTFVPGRNIVLLGLAAAYGIPRGYDTLVTGVCQMDDAGYPDCRADFIGSLRDTIALGMDEPHFEIDAPLLNRTKAQTWTLAEELGVVHAVANYSHTCYEGNHRDMHPWGYGCGECPACKTRAAGFYEWLEASKAPA